MIARSIHAWERRLSRVDTNRVVRPFEWGLDWLDLHGSDELQSVKQWSRDTLSNSGRFYDVKTPGVPQDVKAPSACGTPGVFEIESDVLRFPSAVTSPEPVNNTVIARVFHPPPDKRHPRRAIVVLPQWNSDRSGHVGLCQLFARFGMTAVRLSLPYHDERRPPHLERAEYIVSSNVGRTAAANRQAVLDARRIVDWLVGEGFERIGIMGTSLGSCLAMLTMAHDERIRVGAFNHVSPFFADVVWRGLSTQHVRAGLDGHITLDDLRECWMPISPWPFIDRVRGRAVLLVYALYDLTFPVDLSRSFIGEFARRGIPHTTTALPCGHYTTGKAPFKYLDGYALTKFFVSRL